MLEALMPERARWEASGEEFALRVMGEKGRDCSRSGTVHCFDRLQHRLT
jgi:hypothetical protein